MKFLFLNVTLVLFSISVIAKDSNGGSHSVNGHFKKNGTYVAPHHATNPNNTERDNWSSKPNVNPYTGKQGVKEPKH